MERKEKPRSGQVNRDRHRDREKSTTTPRIVRDRNRGKAHTGSPARVVSGRKNGENDAIAVARIERETDTGDDNLLALADDKQEKEEGKLGQIEDEIDKDNDDDDSGHGNSYLAFDDYYFIARLTYGVFIQFPGEPDRLYGGSIRNSFYSEFPYAVEDEGLFSQTDGKNFSVNFSAHYFYSEADLDGSGFRMKLSPNPLFTTEIFYTNLTETLTTRNDHLQMYSVFVNYNRFRLNRLALWWGVGLKGLRGDNTNTGFAFNSGGEWYLRKPLSVNFSYSGGFINGTYLPEFFGALNLHINRAALFFGYQYWSAGATSIDGITAGLKVFL